MEGLGDHFSFGRWGFREQFSVERLAIAKVKSLSISNKCFRISIASFNLCVDFLNQLGSGHTRAGNDVGSGNRDLKIAPMEAIQLIHDLGTLGQSGFHFFTLTGGPDDRATADTQREHQGQQGPKVRFQQCDHFFGVHACSPFHVFFVSLEYSSNSEGGVAPDWSNSTSKVTG